MQLGNFFRINWYGNETMKLSEALDRLPKGWFKLTPDEEREFKDMTRTWEAQKEMHFCLPPCKDFPDCKCQYHNQKAKQKYGIRDQLTR